MLRLVGLALVAAFAAVALARLGADAPADPHHPPIAPLGAYCVGRQRELGELEVMWEAARAGRGAAAVISGPRGVGKSRLLSELAARVRLDGGKLLRLSAPTAALLRPHVDTERVDFEARFARPEAVVRAVQRGLVLL